MKKNKEKLYSRMNKANGFLFAIVSFVAFAGINLPFAIVFALGMLGISFGIIPLPAGILGDTAPVDQKKALKKVRIMMNKTLDERLANMDELLEGTKLIKEFRKTLKTLSEAKTPEDVVKLKKQIKALEDGALELKDKMKVNAKGRKEDASLTGLLIKGVRQLWDEKKIEKFAVGSLQGLKAQIAFKAADVPMSEGTSVVAIGTAPAFSLTTFDPGLTRVSRRRAFIAELINVARIMTENAAWVEQTTIYPGTAQTQAEGAAATYGSFRWTEQSSKAQLITHIMKATRVMLDDLALLENEIRKELMELVTLKLDQQVLNGSGTGNDLKGILQYAQAFQNFASLAVAAPNNYDALIAAILQVRANGTFPNGNTSEITNIFEPTDIVMHPADIAQMELTKDTLNRYVQQLFPDLTNGGKTLGGCKITENVGMPQGKFLVMDASKSNLRIREDASIALGYENDDFTKGLVSIRAELRAAHYIRTNHLNAFVSDTFANAKTLILAP